MRLRFMVSETWNGLRRNTSMIVSVVIVTMVSLFFLGSGILAQRQVDTIKGYWYDKVQVTVYLCAPDSPNPDCSGGVTNKDQENEIRGELESMRPLVEQVYYESAADAYDRFRETFKATSKLNDVPREAIPASFRVKLSDPQRAGEVFDQFTGRPGVEAVSDQRSVLSGFFKLLRVVSVGALALAAVMALCAVLLIVTTIRQVAFSRRRQVNIMRLVGASSAVIYLPFIAETVLATLIGSALAVGILWAMVEYGIGALLDSDSLIGVITTEDVWLIAPWLVGGAVVLAVLTSWLTLRANLRV